MISVEIRSPDLAIMEQWEVLAARAGANVFMHPEALCAAAAAGFVIHMLLAWRNGELAGLWALRERRIAPFFKYLAAPPYEYAFVSNPVIDPAHAGPVMRAYFEAIANDPALPKVIRLDALDGESDAFRAMMSELGMRQGPTLTLSEHARPFLGDESQRKRSGSTAKKLRQDWNRLAALGNVDIANERAPGAVRAAFDVFLDLEARSWKGASGTALLSRDGDATFTRRLIGALAARGQASVALLRLDGKPVAAQVLLYSGAMAYTWKTAFDAAFAKYSPGALLLDKVCDTLFAGGIRQVESCSPETSFMTHLWAGRRTTVHVLIDVGVSRSPTFALCTAGERVVALLREQRNRLRAISWLPMNRRKSLAPTRG